MLGVYLYDIIFFAIPILVIAFFVVSLCLYLSAKKKNKLTPGSVSPEALNIRKLLLIISSALGIVFIAILIGIIALFAMAIAFM